jgi:uncharacterized delta-60 repeat protein
MLIPSQFLSLFLFLTRAARNNPTRSAQARRKQRPALVLERLEDRTVPSAGVLDGTFGDPSLSGMGRTGTTTTQLLPTSAIYAPLGIQRTAPHSVAVQRDGKIVVAGFASQGLPFVPLTVAAVARYNNDGSLDTTFGTARTGVDIVGNTFPIAGNGVDILDIPPAQLGAIALQPDATHPGQDKILVTGAGYVARYWQADYEPFIARLNADGSLDTSFNGSGVEFGVGGRFAALAVQSDRTILVAGEDGRVDRLGADGGVVSYGQPLGFQAVGLAIQSDGSIVVAGTTVFLGVGDIVVTRLDSTGSPDPNFGNNGTQTIDFNPGLDQPIGVAIQANGGIVVAANTYQDADLTTDYFAVARLDPTGKLDTTFGNAGKQTILFGTGDDWVNDFALEPDDKIVLVGYSHQPAGYDFAVARFAANGDMDTAFGTSSKTPIDFGSADDEGVGVAIQPDGKIVVAGYSDQGLGMDDFAVARLLGGAMNVTTPAAVTDQLDQLIAEANLSGQPSDVAFQVNTVSDASTVVNAINDLSSQGITFNGTVTLNLAPITYGGLTVNVPNGMTLVIGTTAYTGGQQATIDPDLPAFTLLGGNVVVSNVTFVTTGDAPTILVQGGNLTLRNDTIQETTGFNDAAILLTGGTLDLGETSDSGNDVFVLYGPGAAVQNTTANAVPEVGDTFTIVKASPVFSNVSAPLVTDGGTATLSGILSDGVLAPTGSVSITVNGVTETADIHPDGTFSALFNTTGWGVGALTIDYAFAGDSYFNDAEATANLDLTYGVLVVTNLSKARQAGSTIPIQIELLNAGGQDVSAAGVTVTAVDITSGSSTFAVTSPGNSDPGGVFQLVSGRQAYYLLNLQTKDLAGAGTYTLWFTVLGDPIEHSIQFVLK